MRWWWLGDRNNKLHRGGSYLGPMVKNIHLERCRSWTWSSLCNKVSRERESSTRVSRSSTAEVVNARRIAAKLFKRETRGHVIAGDRSSPNGRQRSPAQRADHRRDTNHLQISTDSGSIIRARGPFHAFPIVCKCPTSFRGRTPRGRWSSGVAVLFWLNATAAPRMQTCRNCTVQSARSGPPIRNYERSPRRKGGHLNKPFTRSSNLPRLPHEWT